MAREGKEATKAQTLCLVMPRLRVQHEPRGSGSPGWPRAVMVILDAFLTG